MISITESPVEHMKALLFLLFALGVIILLPFLAILVRFLIPAIAIAIACVFVGSCVSGKIRRWLET